MSRDVIWVIDDEPGMVRAVERSLARTYRVRGFLDAREALDALTDPDSIPDIVILDIRMPTMDGFEVMNRLNEKTPTTDVILMTGSMTEPDAHFTRAIREKAFYFLHKPFDGEVLQTLVLRCLELRRLAEENRRHLQRLEEELFEARAFQQSLLPKPSSQAGGFRIESLYRPCAELGGDFFDFVEVGPQTITFLVADASGHGASSAMMNSVVKSALHGGTRAQPLSVIERIAEGIEFLGDDRFITVFCARLDGKRGKMEYVNAGHPAPWIRRADGTLHRLGRTGPLVSPALPDGPWECCDDIWRPGDRLLTYTDGVTEVAGDTGLFGEGPIEDVIARGDGDGRRCIDNLMTDLTTFANGRPFKDDLTLLVVDFPLP